MKNRSEPRALTGNKGSIIGERLELLNLFYNKLNRIRTAQPANGGNIENLLIATTRET